MICETGGQKCIDDWVKSNTKSFTRHEITIDGSIHHFIIFSDGEVIDSRKKVVCKTGGRPCLDAYSLTLMPTEEINIVDVTINGFNY
jgi:hypothetical protein